MGTPSRAHSLGHTLPGTGPPPGTGRRAQAPLRAQTSMEFMIIFMLFLVATGVAMAASVNRSHAISQAQMDMESHNLLRRVSGGINTACLEGDGFSMDVTVPERMLRLDYTIDINSNEAILRVAGNTYVQYLLTNNVTGDIAKGTNRILNSNGEIVITEAP